VAAKPKETSTLEREAFFNNRVSETKWVKQLISKGIGK
jgi:hypothetical protein